MAYVKQINAKIEEIKQDNMKEYTQTFESKDDKPFAYGFCFTKLFYLFVIVFFQFWARFLKQYRRSVLTDILKCVSVRLYGPFIPVYGGGARFSAYCFV